MTNPDNAVGTNAAYGGRTSANAFNDDLSVYSRGIMSGWACAPSSGLTVVLGGDGSTRDVAVAEDNAGNKTTINNISGSPVSVTLDAAPASNSRIDAIVAYVDNPPQGSSTIADNYEACGLIAVAGTAASSPVAPTDGAIRSAITADGASGATAYYVVLATITIASGTTDIVADNITAGLSAMIQARNIDSSISTATATYLDSHVREYSARPLSCSKNVNTVLLEGVIQLANYSSSDATLATDLDNCISIPEEFAPLRRLIFFASGAGNIPVRVMITPDGYLSLGQALGGYGGQKFKLAQNSTISISFTYITS